MRFPRRLFASSLVLSLAALACTSLRPPTGPTATPTGEIGAVELGTPALQGNKKDYQIWSGTITSQTSRQFMSNGSVVNTCTTDWITDLDFAVDSAGNVAGAGQAVLSAARVCSPKSNIVANTTTMTIAVHGRKDSSAFTLDLNATEFKPSPSGDFGGYALLITDGACPGTKRNISVPTTGSSTATVQLHLSGILTGCGGSQDDSMKNESLVNLQFRFKCSDVPADINDPVLRQLCQ